MLTMCRCPFVLAFLISFDFYQHFYILILNVQIGPGETDSKNIKDERHDF